MPIHSEKTKDKARLVLLEFSADWCGSCQTINPIIQVIKTECAEFLKLVEIDSDQNKSAAIQFNVRSIPTLILFKNGKEVWRRAGLISKSDMYAVLERYRAPQNFEL